MNLVENVYGHRKRLDWIRCHLDRTDRVIEIGCGTGYMVTLPLALDGFDVVGVDTDGKSIEAGKLVFESEGCSSSRLIRGEFVDVELEPDVVIASEVLEHLRIEEVRSTLRLIRNRLAPGGELLITVPNGYGWFEMESFLWSRTGIGRLIEALGIDRVVGRLKRWILGDEPDHAHPSTLSSSPHVQRFTIASICREVAMAGLEVTEVTGTVLVAGPFSNLAFTGWRTGMLINSRLGSMFPRIASGILLRAEVPEYGGSPDAKSRARSVWGASPAGSSHAPGETPGTREFFSEALSRRSELELPWLGDVVPFAALSGARVLELGCGVGFDAYEFMNSGADYFGIDITPENPVRTRAHLGYYGLDPHVVEADIERIPFAADSFDAAYSNGVIHHTPDPIAVLREAYRVMRPNARLWVIVYNRDSIFHWLTLGLAQHVLRGGYRHESFSRRLGKIEQSSSDEIPLVRVYSRRELEELLTTAGFTVEGMAVRKLAAEDLPHVPGFPNLWQMVPPRVLDSIGTRFGWYLIARARK